MKPPVMNLSVGITGFQSFSKSSSGDGSKYEITIAGSARAHKIPKVIVFCEDEFAELMIGYALQHINLNIGAFKIIQCGVWRNILKTLTGFLIYENELIESGNEKALKAVGIIDGDISNHELNQNIEKTYHGKFPPQDLKYIQETISQHLVGFNLAKKITDLPENSTGTPEFNFKSMIDEITDEMVDNHHQEEISKREDWLLNLKDESHRAGIQIEINDHKTKIKETKEIISISRSIESTMLPTNENKKFDYHNFLGIFQEKILDKNFKEYNYTRYADLVLYRIISTYNKKNWEEYISPVINLLRYAYNEQTKRFNHHSFNNQRLD
ncbi:hypothetical protein AC790_09005 [Pantoea sp. RIT-PI-b]|uniref:hypothetical protein n=1 Tax=Pantoea sp. RIT-PI-b TaxID=1681195 RepID=UPI00067614B3|nr:hypothetical protein [Pantoea sp. RIT-PI-b]KNC14325.1 hypothetical protein AC790_09005 [Pantoea sp. RIT-PI-b]